jgi:hypothetical protein
MVGKALVGLLWRVSIYIIIIIIIKVALYFMYLSSLRNMEILPLSIYL